MTTCKACGQPILFVKFPSGKLNPINCDPQPNGNIIMAEDATNFDARVLKRDELAIARENAIPLYSSHFANCPAAGSFRSKP